MKHSVRTAIFVALQLLILIVIAVLPLRTLAKGEVLRLMVEPLDPRDLFRGDYVVLRYTSLSSRPIDPVTGRIYRPGDTIFVSLTLTPMPEWPSPLGLPGPHGATHPGELAIRGKVVRVVGDSIDVEYGIESFFVPQGRGRDIERTRSGLSAEVAVDGRGRAVLRRLFIGTVPFP